MNKQKRRPFPKALFALLSIAGLIVSGIYIGILTTRGFSGVQLLKAITAGAFGLLMMLGVYRYKP